MGYEHHLRGLIVRILRPYSCFNTLYALTKVCTDTKLTPTFVRIVQIRKMKSRISTRRMNNHTEELLAAPIIETVEALAEASKDKGWCYAFNTTSLYRICSRSVERRDQSGSKCKLKASCRCWISKLPCIYIDGQCISEVDRHHRWRT